jgi:peptidoglycan/LPS O-acetylase OafA/YrhL
MSLINSTKTDPYHTGKLFGLDHLRAFAISFVLIYHYRSFGHPAWVEAVGKFGWTGVDLFFVLSGFLISTELFKELSKTRTISLTKFFIRRSFRILPAYLLLIAIYFRIPAFREREALPPLLKFLTFTQNLGLDLSKGGTFSHAWSLCVEEQFYLLLPLALVLLYRSQIFKKAGYLLPSLVVFGLTIRLLTWYLLVVPHIDDDNFWVIWYKWIYYPIYTRLDGLITGIAIAALFRFKADIAARIAKHGNLLFLSGIVILACAYFVCFNERSYYATIYGFPLVAMGYGAVVISAISPGSFLHSYRIRITEKLAGLSYGIYLIHKGIIHLVQKYASGMGIPMESNRMLLICLFFVLLGALLLQLVVERPFLRLRKMVLQRVADR